MLRFLMAGVLLFCCVAHANFYDERSTGYWFYQLYLDGLMKNQQAKLSPEFVAARIAAIKAEFKYKQELAFLHPTYENVKSFRVLQKQVLDQSTAFANSWMYVTATNPDLDETVKYPMSQVGSIIYQNEKMEHENKLLTNLANSYGLIFFYSDGCAYCHKLSPILKAFSDKHGLTILPVSIDGGVLSDFPDSKIDTGQAKALGIDRLPAIVAVDTENNKSFAPIYGFLTEDLLVKRLVLLIEGKDV